MPVTSDCDKDVMSLCLRNQGLESFPVGQVKQCLIDLGIPDDPSIVLAAEVRIICQWQCIWPILVTAKVWVHALTSSL